MGPSHASASPTLVNDPTRTLSLASRLSVAALAFGIALGAAACGGGGSSLFNNDNVFTGGDDDGPGSDANFGVVSCSLGGSPCGGGLNQINQNQTLSFVFNGAVSSGTVTSETLSIVELNQAGGGGAEPPGIRKAIGNTVTFQPEASFDSNGNVLYGFKPNTTYRLRIPAVPNTSVLSTNGKGNTVAVDTFFQVNSQVSDVVPGAPTACLTKPAALVNVASNADVQITFNDIMDATTLVNKVSGTSTSMAVRVDLDGDALTSNDQVDISGTWDIAFITDKKQTVVSFVHPQVPFPGPGALDNHRIVVAMNPLAIKDLGGNTLDTTKDCNGAVFTPGQFPFKFKTLSAAPQDFSIVETFDSDVREDKNATGADMWNGTAGPGELRRGFGGGRGTLGDFFATSANDASQVGAYATDGVATVDPLRTPFTVAANSSLDGVETTVTNGIFQFASFQIPAGIRVRFEGPVPARIYSRGVVRVEGTLDVGGDNASKGLQTVDAGTNTPCTITTPPGGVPAFPQFPFGKKGGRAGCLGGDGGRGGDLPTNAPGYNTAAEPGNSFVSFHGSAGKDGPGATPATGGKGSEAAAVIALSGTDFFAPMTQTFPPPAVGVLLDVDGDALPEGIILAAYSSPQTKTSIQYGAGGGGGGSFFDDGTNGGWCTAAAPPGLPCVLQPPPGFSGAAGDGKLPAVSPPVSLVKPYYPLPPPGMRGFKGTAIVAPNFGSDGVGNFSMLRGGAGGGGGGANPSGTNTQGVPNSNWTGVVPSFSAPAINVGAGGGGGGGALQVQAGRDIIVPPVGLGHGTIDASGGDGGDHVDPTWFSTFQATPKCGAPPPAQPFPTPALQEGFSMAPGGGGGGGAVLLQAGGALSLANLAVTVRGGIGGEGRVLGGLNNVLFVVTTMGLTTSHRLRGGDGGNGRAHYQLQGVVPDLSAGFDPPTAASSSTFTGINPAAADLSGAQSKFYAFPSSALVFQLKELNVQIETTSGTQTLVQDDVTKFDVTNGAFPAGPLPFRILFQGARAGADGQPNPLSFTPWTNALTSLSNSSPEFVRFVVIFDRAHSLAHPEFLGITRVEIKGQSE